MFGWVHKKKITKLAEAARAFVDANYKELPKNSTRTSEGVRYSRRLNNDNLPKFSRETEPQIKYSLSEEPESKPEAEVLKLRFDSRRTAVSEICGDR